MIDRLEMFTDAELTLAGLQKLSRFSGGYTSKMIAEDEELKELKITEGGMLYKNLFVLSSKVNTRTGEEYEDPVRFYVFAYPKFKRNGGARFKIVLNPSKVPMTELIDFLYTNFDHPAHLEEKQFSKQFRLGRVDFAVDVRDFTVAELRAMVFVANKTRKHNSIFKVEDDGSGFIRIWEAVNPETMYVGNGDVILRIYDKVLEARHQVAVCKREGRKIPERLQQLADARTVTRIELQLRSISTSGLTVKDGKVVEKKQKRGFHRLRTLWDLQNLKRSHVDMFDDVLFQPRHMTEYFDSDWMNKGFNALIMQVGFDQAVKCLPPDKRREVKESLRERTFPHDLNEIIYTEARTWLQS